MSKWPIPPGGSIMEPSKAERYLMSDGELYSSYDLVLDGRNVHDLASKTFHTRLHRGERDINTIFERRKTTPKRVPPGKGKYAWGRTK